MAILVKLIESVIGWCAIISNKLVLQAPSATLKF